MTETPQKNKIQQYPFSAKNTSFNASLYCQPMDASVKHNIVFGTLLKTTMRGIMEGNQGWEVGKEANATSVFE